jgi:hypothetical protein
VRCSEGGFTGEEHDAIKSIAFVLVWLWPVGMFTLYCAVLLPCGANLRARVQTPLVRATRCESSGVRTHAPAPRQLELHYAT